MKLQTYLLGSFKKKSLELFRAAARKCMAIVNRHFDEKLLDHAPLYEIIVWTYLHEINIWHITNSAHLVLPFT